MGTRMIAIALDQDIGDVMGGSHYSRESYKERVDSRPALDQIVAEIDNSVFCETSAATRCDCRVSWRWA